MATWRARKRGGRHPHLRVCDRFSIDDYKFEVRAVRDNGIRVALLDEERQPCIGTVITDHVEVAPPLVTRKPLPASMRGRLNLAARLMGFSEGRRRSRRQVANRRGHRSASPPGAELMSVARVPSSARHC